MNEVQAQIQGIRQGSPTPAEAAQAISRLKAAEVAKRWTDFPGKNLNGVAAFQTKNGPAYIGAVVHSVDAEGLDSVEVWLGPQVGPPAFRIINPPILVADPVGEVVMTERDPQGRNNVRRFRVDPLQAIAEVVASRFQGEGS